MPSRSSDFEEWVDTWFVISDEDGSDDEEVWNLSSQEEAEYCTRLFENPEFLVEKFTRQQLATGFWKIFGIDGSWRGVMDSSVPELVRRRCVRAIGALYTKLFDPLCESIPDEMQDKDSFCTAVFMIWDLNGVDVVQTYPELRDDCVSVLWAAINCQSAACISSGLHGMGHWIQKSEHRGETELFEWLRSCVDDFLLRYRLKADASASLIQYALNARSGCVM
jgi:hypothetical protein